MKDLFLIRHAKSSWTDDSLRDIDRPLNKRGKRQVEAMARPLLTLGALDSLIHASHACRARQTIEGVLEHLPEQGLASRVHFDPALYTFRWKRLFKWLKQRPDDVAAVTLIGHNPALTDLAAALTGDKVGDMGTGAMIHLRIPITSWQELSRGKADLIRYLPPSRASYSLYLRQAPKMPGAKKNLQKQVPVALAHQLETILALQPGVQQGVDPEFLHQFRINLRRSRALIEALVKITGEDTLARAVKPLRHIARQSNLLRDLDVFLSWLETQAADHPPLRRSLRASGALDVFGQWREREQLRLSRQLEQKSWRKGLKHWQATVSGKTLSRALKNTTPQAIHGTVRQQAGHCLGLFRDLSARSPDEDFHELRKALKRLRYVAELDEPFYREVLQELKDQQSLYGEFQDRHQQQLLLAALARERRDGRLPPVMAELAQKIDDDKQTARETILARPPRLERAQGRPQ